MLRSIEGYRQDVAGDWVAELSCLHAQHVRHRPPFFDRPWVRTRSGREERIGTDLDCPLCDRAELPEGLRCARVAGPFDADTLPAGLRRQHVVADHTWAVLHVLDGSVTFLLPTLAEPQVLHAGDRHAIPPRVPHALELLGPVRLTVEFLTRWPNARRAHLR